MGKHKKFNIVINQIKNKFKVKNINLPKDYIQDLNSRVENIVNEDIKNIILELIRINQNQLEVENGTQNL